MRMSASTDINETLVQQSLRRKAGTVVEATITPEPNSAKNAQRKRDLEMHRHAALLQHRSTVHIAWRVDSQRSGGVRGALLAGG